MDRNEIIKRIREKGLTYRDIGEVFNISKQRAHQLATGYRSPSSAECARRYKAAHKSPSKPRSKMTPEQVKVKRREYYLKNREWIVEREKRRYAMRKQEVE